MISEYKTLLATTKFRFLWTSQVLSQLSINLLNFLILTRLFKITGSSLATSFLWVSYALPAIFIGPFASAAADIISRKKILIMTNLLQSIVVFSYAFMPQYKPFLAYGIAFLYSLLNQFYVPAEAASLPSLVDKKNLHTANTLFFLTQQGSLILGYGFAGILENVIGFKNTVLISAIFLFVAYVSVLSLPEMKSAERIVFDMERTVGKFLKNIKEGYRYILHQRGVLVPFVLLFSIQVVSTVVTVSTPQIAKELLKIDINTAGMAIVVPVAIGAAIGAFISTKYLSRKVRKKVIIEKSFLALFIIIIGLAFIMPVVGNKVLRLAFSTFLLGVAGAAFVSIIIPSQTFLQESTPEWLRGRVFGNFGFLVTVATVIPIIFSGAIVELFGVRLLLTVLCVLALAVYILSRKLGDRFLRSGN